MAKAPAPDSAEDLQPELDSLADELYALRPDDFAAARDERVRAARVDGKAALAREVARLRKPTISAWLINLVWRDQRDVMQQLFELADEMAQAQASAAGPVLRELTTQRRQIETALLRRAAALAREAGVDVSDSVVREAQETLSAALAQPEVADEVRTGRLVKPAAYSGFGTLPASRPSTTPKRETPAATPAQEAREPIDLQAAQRVRAEREKAERRAAAERRVAEARAAAETASGILAERARAADAARQRLEDFRQRVEALQEQLKRAEAEAATAEDAATAAAARRKQAESAHMDAQQSLNEAERALKEIENDGGGR
jgi:hypothetical protein